MRRNYRKVILSFLAGNLNLYLFYKLRSTRNVTYDKDKKYLQLFDKWMFLSERGDTIDQFFKTRNIKEIAIYGYGNIGKHLVTQLSDSDINIKFVIDKRKKSVIGNNIPCFHPSDNLPRVDAIVITPICEYTEIKNALKEITSAESISIEDIIYELL